MAESGRAPQSASSEVTPQPTPASEAPSAPLQRQMSFLRDAHSGAASEEKLMQLGLPYEVAKLVAQESKQIARRIFLLDNSGSTAVCDGKILDDVNGKKLWRRCSRWDEIKHMALNHAKWSTEFGVPAEFVLLNTFSGGGALQEGMDFLMVDPTKDNAEEQVAAVQRLLDNTGPRGCTPVTERLRRIREQLQPQAMELARNGQQVIVVLVTDGLPSPDGRRIEHEPLIQELRRYSMDLPAHLVVRLCTDDDKVADFYNQVDAEVELQLEIVDDMKAEAQECYRSGNRFVVYSELLQLLREGGTFLKILDLVDERRLEPMEVALFCQLIIRKPDDPPLPSDPKEFLVEVHRQLSQCQDVYDVLYQRWGPPLRFNEVEKAVLSKGRGCDDLIQRECGSQCTLM